MAREYKYQELSTLRADYERTELGWKQPVWLRQLTDCWPKLSAVLAYHDAEVLAEYLLDYKWHNTLRWPYAIQHHLSTSGRRLEFDDKPYLKRIYLDQHECIVLKKAVQVYCTDWAICEALS